MGDICEKCRYFRNVNYGFEGENFGQCRRYPPHYDEDNCREDHFPVVHPTDDCGEFKPVKKNRQDQKALFE